MKGKYLVCYDISDPLRLSRVFRYMKGRGIHLQYSVFYCSFTRAELNEVKEGLRSIIDERSDDVRIYPLPSACKIIVMGCGDRIPDGVDIYLD